LTLEPLEGRALLSLTTWTVNSLGDTGTGSGTSGDLRYVITQADQTQGDNTINFAVTGTITLNSALPDLSNTSGLTDIEGPGATSLTVARSSAAGTPDFRIFTVDAGTQVSLFGLTITGGLANGSGGGIYNGGTLTLTSSTVSGNSTAGVSYDGGGGIYNDYSGTMSLTDSTVDGNSTAEDDGYGGGIFNVGTMTLTASSVSDNSTAGGYAYGGGIGNGGTMNVLDSTVSGNRTTGDYSRSGGIDNGNYGTLTLTGCTVSDNSTNGYSANGGGIGGGHGIVTLIGCTVRGNRTNGDYSTGGGIVNETGTMTVTNSTIDNNGTAFEGGGIYAAGTATVTNSTIDNNGTAFEGGGIYVAGMATVTNSTIDNNSSGGGGGIDNFEGAVTVTNSTIDNNLSGGGGGILNFGTLTLTNSAIDNNSAHITRVPASGGGITNLGMLTVTDSAIDNNSVVNDGYLGPGGGGIYNGGTLTLADSSIIDNDSSGEGGGIYVAGTATVTNSTIANNSAGDYGGGIANGGTLTLTNSTIADNSAGGYGGGLFAFESSTTLVDNTLIALNTSGTGTPDDISSLFGGTVSSASAYNLIGIGGSGGLVNGTNGNQVGVADPGLDPNGLQNNGGPTQTIALVTGSPAIDAGSNALAVDPTTGQPLTTDQRGFPRIVNGTVDIGAYEVQSYITAVAVGWGTQTAALQTAADGLRLLPAGRNTDLPWLGIDRVQITLTQPATLAAGDISVIGSSGTNYGPVTVTGSGTSYTITLAQPINAADRVTITIGNDLIAPFTRRLDVLPGDVNDDGVVNVQDLVAIRNQMLGLMGAMPTIFGDINGDGTVDINDYTAVRELIGTTLPSIT